MPGKKPAPGVAQIERVGTGYVAYHPNLPSVAASGATPEVAFARLLAVFPAGVEQAVADGLLRESLPLPERYEHDAVKEAAELEDRRGRAIHNIQVLATQLPDQGLDELLDAIERIALKWRHQRPRGHFHWFESIVPPEAAGPMAIDKDTSPDDAALVVQRRAREMKLVGHHWAGGFSSTVDVPLFNAQAKAMAEMWDRARALQRASEAAADAMLADWTSFLDGAVVAVDATEGHGYKGALTWKDDVRPAMVPAIFPDDLAALEGGEPVNRENLRINLVNLVMSVLIGRGLIRTWTETQSPCEDCGREIWVPPHRSSSHGGQNRLCDRLCPACEVLHVRLRAAAAQRAKYQRRRNQRQAAPDRKM